MKRTILLLLSVLLLAACTAVTPPPAPTATAAPTSTPAPSPTPLPTAPATPTPVPTIMPTPIPTLPPEQVGGLSGIPDPHAAAPELLDLRKSDAPIPQFVNAMKMGGIEVDPQEVANNLQYQAITVDGKQHIIGFYHLDPNPNQTGETLEGPIPLVIWGEKEGWRKAGLDKFGVTFGTGLWFKSKEGTIYEPRYDKIVSENFSQATISSGIHWKWLEREPDIIDYKWSVNYDMKGQLQQLDKFRNIKRVKLHALFFPQFAPEWLNNMSSDEVLRHMEEHVMFLAERYKRYKNIVQEVDVVNEPYYNGPLFTGKGTFTREDVLYRKLVPDYIIKAFEMAREYFGPDVKLVYNDLANHSKIYGPNGGYYQNTLNNVNRLKEEGLVDIVGCQMHLDAAYPPTKAEMIEAFRSYGIPVEISELDVRLDNLGGNISAQERMKIQAKIYRDVIEAALESGVVSSITIWDVGDKYSYYEHWGGGSENSDATLFDENFNPRPAYYSVLQALFVSQ